MTTTQETREAVLDVLRSSPVAHSVAGLSERLGIPAPAIRRALHGMRDRGEAQRMRLHLSNGRTQDPLAYWSIAGAREVRIFAADDIREAAATPRQRGKK